MFISLNKLLCATCVPVHTMCHVRDKNVELMISKSDYICTQSCYKQGEIVRLLAEVKTPSSIERYLRHP